MLDIEPSSKLSELLEIAKNATWLTKQIVDWARRRVSNPKPGDPFLEALKALDLSNPRALDLFGELLREHYTGGDGGRGGDGAPLVVNEPLELKGRTAHGGDGGRGGDAGPGGRGGDGGHGAPTIINRSILGGGEIRGGNGGDGGHGGKRSET